MRYEERRGEETASSSDLTFDRNGNLTDVRWLEWESEKASQLPSHK